MNDYTFDAKCFGTFTVRAVSEPAARAALRSNSIDLNVTWTEPDRFAGAFEDIVITLTQVTVDDDSIEIVENDNEEEAGA